MIRTRSRGLGLRARALSVVAVLLALGERTSGEQHAAWFTYGGKKLAPLWSDVIKGEWVPLQPQSAHSVVLIRGETTCFAVDANSGKERWRHSCGDARFRFSVRAAGGKAYLLKHSKVGRPRTRADAGPIDAVVENAPIPQEPEVQVVDMQTGKIVETIVLKRPQGAADPRRLPRGYGGGALQWQVDGKRIYVEWVRKHSVKDERIARMVPIVCAYESEADENPVWRFEPEEEKRGRRLFAPHSQWAETGCYWLPSTLVPFRTRGRASRSTVTFVPSHGRRLWLLEAATGKVLWKKGPPHETKEQTKEKKGVLGDEALGFIGPSVWNYSIEHCQRAREAECSIFAGPYPLGDTSEALIHVGVLRRFPDSDEWVILGYDIEGRARSVVTLTDPLIGNRLLLGDGTVVAPTLDSGVVMISDRRTAGGGMPIFLTGSGRGGARVEWLTRVEPKVYGPEMRSWSGKSPDWKISARNVTQWIDVKGEKILYVLYYNGRSEIGSGPWTHTVVLMDRKHGGVHGVGRLFVDAPVVDRDGRALTEDRIREGFEKGGKSGLLWTKEAKWWIRNPSGEATHVWTKKPYFGSIVGAHAAGEAVIFASLHDDQEMRLTAFPADALIRLVVQPVRQAGSHDQGARIPRRD